MLVWLWLSACAGGGGGSESAATEGDTDTDTDTDTDADTDADTDTDTGDTGAAAAYWVGAFDADASGAFVSGRFGWAYYGVGVREWICTASGSFAYEGEAPAGCPDCTWAWDLSALQGSTAVGDHCQSDEIQWTDGALDGYVDYAWGFAPTYLYDYAGVELTFEDNVLLYDEDGWTVFAFNLPAYDIYQTDGDALHVELYRQITDADGNPYYYYYFP